MIFNNELETENLLTSSYLSGNILFHKDALYTPVLNYVKKIDLVHNHTRVLPFQTHNQINKIVIHPAGIILIAIDMAGYAIVFNLKGMFTVAEFNFKGPVSCAEFSEDAQLFCVTQAHGFSIYECPPFWRTFQPFVLLKKYKKRHSADILNAKFSPDSRFLVTCGLDNIIYINNLFPIEGYIAMTLQVHRFKILGVAYSSDMNYIYSIDSGSNVYVWKWTNENITEGYMNFKAAKLRRRNNKQGNGKRVKREAKQEQSQNSDDEIKQTFNPEYSEFEQKVGSGRYVLATKLIVTQPGAYLKRFSYDAKTGFFATAYSNGKFSIYKLVKEEVTEVQSFSVGSYKISSLCVNDSCTWIGMAIKSLGQIIVWEWKSQSYILSQKGLVHDTQALAACRNGKLIGTGTFQGQVKLWDKHSGLCVATFNEHQSAVTDIKFSNSQTLFSCSRDGNVHAYDAVRYRKFRTYRPDSSCQLSCLGIEQSGDIVFAGAFDPYEVYAWNVQSGNILQIIKGHEGPLTSLQVTGQHIITGSWDRTLKIHEIYAKKLNVQTLQHSSQITALALHPDGKKIAAATIKGELYIWEIETGQLIGIIEAEVTGGRSYTSKVSAQNDKNAKFLKTMAFSDCGNYIIGGGRSKYLTVYDIRHRMLIKRIQITRNRDLQGVVSKLNSKFIQQGYSTHQMMLQEQQINSDDQYGATIKLPGSKKIDVSEIRQKLQVEVNKIVFMSSQSFAVLTSFGVLVYSTNLYNRFVFNPYELLEQVTPASLCELLKSQQYSAGLMAALSLNLPVRKILRKIPKTHIKQTLAELDLQKLNILLQKLSLQPNDLRECLWVEAILKIPGVKVPASMQLSIQNMLQQVGLMKKIRAKLEVPEILQL